MLPYKKLLDNRYNFTPEISHSLMNLINSFEIKNLSYRKRFKYN